MDEEKLKAVEDELRRRGFNLAYVFGSRVTGRNHENRNMDVGVVVGKSIDDLELIKIEKEVQEAVGEDLDPVDLRIQDTRFTYNALRESILMFSDDEELRIEFEHETIREYLEMKCIYVEYDSEGVNFCPVR